MTETKLQQDERNVAGLGAEERQKTPPRQPSRTKAEISETWAEETIADLDEFIESQGIYIRQ